MEKLLDYLPPKIYGASLLELEAAILQASELTVTSRGQESIYMDTYDGDYWE